MISGLSWYVSLLGLDARPPFVSTPVASAPIIGLKNGHRIHSSHRRRIHVARCVSPSLLGTTHAKKGKFPGCKLEPPSSLRWTFRRSETIVREPTNSSSPFRLRFRLEGC
ncbi:hypothetical protein V6N13_041082 [Hibiscus sabdariffa]